MLSNSEEFVILGNPCLIVEGQHEHTEDSIKKTLSQYQFKITLPTKIYPASLYSYLSAYSKIVQLVSCNPLPFKQSDSYIVTLANPKIVKEMKKINLKDQNVNLEEIKGQLVYRPSKHSKLTDN